MKMKKRRNNKTNTLKEVGNENPGHQKAENIESNRMESMKKKKKKKKDESTGKPEIKGGERRMEK